MTFSAITDLKPFLGTNHISNKPLPIYHGYGGADVSTLDDAFLWLPYSAYPLDGLPVINCGAGAGFERAPVGTRRRLYLGAPLQIVSSPMPGPGFLALDNDTNCTYAANDILEFTSLDSFDGVTGAWQLSSRVGSWAPGYIDGHRKGAMIKALGTQLHVRAEQIVTRDWGPIASGGIIGTDMSTAYKIPGNSGYHCSQLLGIDITFDAAAYSSAALPPGQGRLDVGTLLPVHIYYIYALQSASGVAVLLSLDPNAPAMPPFDSPRTVYTQYARIGAVVTNSSSPTGFIPSVQRDYDFQFSWPVVAIDEMKLDGQWRQMPIWLAPAGIVRHKITAWVTGGMIEVSSAPLDPVQYDAPLMRIDGNGSQTCELVLDDSPSLWWRATGSLAGWGVSGWTIF